MDFWYLTWNFPIWTAFYTFLEVGKFHVQIKLLAFDMNFPHFNHYIYFFEVGKFYVLKNASGIWHENSPIDPLYVSL